MSKYDGYMCRVQNKYSVYVYAELSLEWLLMPDKLDDISDEVLLELSKKYSGSPCYVQNNYTGIKRFTPPYYYEFVNTQTKKGFWRNVWDFLRD
jgi:hypothetical protein